MIASNYSRICNNLFRWVEPKILRVSRTNLCYCFRDQKQYITKRYVSAETDIISTHVGLKLKLGHIYLSSHNSTFLPNNIQLRFISSASEVKSKDSSMNLYKPKERTFKTPYGQIAALEWGNPEASKKVLCVHGWLDNAGSFEPLMPHILKHGDNSKNYHIVAIDHPGTGLSSHKPTGSEYTTFSTIIEMRRVINDLGWNKFSIIGHSLGSHYSFLYSCIYSYQIESMISIDLEHPIGRGLQNWDVILNSSIEECFRNEYFHKDDPTTNIRVPVYSEEDAIKRLMDGHSNSLTVESAKILLKRGATKGSWGYTFNRDLRLRSLFVEFRPDDDTWRQYIKMFFHANLLVIRATRTPYRRPESLRKSYYELFEKNCRYFRDVEVEGTHHLHMNTPETVAPEINRYLDEIDSGGGCEPSGLGRSKL